LASRGIQRERVESRYATSCSGDAVDARIERQNHAHTGCVRLFDEIRLREIKPIQLVDPECAKQRLRVDRP